MVLGLSIAAIILSMASLFLSAWAIVDLMATKRSTHRLEYIGATPSNISNSVEEINNKNKEEISETFPFFNNPKKDKFKGL